MDTKAQRINACIKVLGDPRSGRACRAEERLITIGEQALPALIESADSPSRQVRARVAWVMGGIGDSRAFDALLKLTNDPVTFVRYDAAWALGKLHDYRAVPILIDYALSADEAGVSPAAASGLFELGRCAVSPLLKAFETGTPQDKRSIAHIIASMGDDVVFEPAQRFVHDLDPEIRWVGIECLAILAENHFQKFGQQCSELIKECAADPDNMVSGTAAYWIHALQKHPTDFQEQDTPRAWRARLLLSEKRRWEKFRARRKRIAAYRLIEKR